MLAKPVCVVCMQLYSQDGTSGVLHRPWREDVRCEADAHVFVHTADARESLGGSEVRDLEHACKHLPGPTGLRVRLLGFEGKPAFGLAMAWT